MELTFATAKSRAWETSPPRLILTMEGRPVAIAFVTTKSRPDMLRYW